MKIVWCSDLHLNWASKETIAALIVDIRSHKPDAVLLSGDISDGNSTKAFVKFLYEALETKIYFVLGNHDFYKRYITEVEQWCFAMSRKNSDIVYLPNAGVVPLTESTALVGVNGWGDCKAGNWRDSTVVLSDHRYIGDLAGLNRVQLAHKLQAFGEIEAITLRDALERALARFDAVQVLTHVPPFPEAATYKGKQSDDAWTPFFVCQSVGEVLMDLAARHPKKFITVMCGHSHGESHIKPLPNLTVHTAYAAYRRPQIAEVFEV